MVLKDKQHTFTFILIVLVCIIQNRLLLSLLSVAFFNKQSSCVPLSGPTCHLVYRSFARMSRLVTLLPFGLTLGTSLCSIGVFLGLFSI